MISSDKRVGDLVFVLDVVRGLLKAGIHQYLCGETFDVGTAKGPTERAFVVLLAELKTGSTIKLVFEKMPQRVGERSQIAGSEAIRRMLGREPAWSLRERLRETVHRYETQLEAV